MKKQILRASATLFLLALTGALGCMGQNGGMGCGKPAYDCSQEGPNRVLAQGQPGADANGCVDKPATPPAS
ncbi:MAG: hypothetical protein KGO96_01725 [Elusimicrobia bacterium]|nr:hypothetical protein [Elusimicrobiota bacterium]MDE2237633.1 hypothetical protein [Elusimicrobiota bacterium]MDE2424614.1 hypothetical protein [Elusimicrobiota bacterium]